MKPRILVSKSNDGWVAMAAEAIGQTIHSTIFRRNVCNVILTGGRTAESLYQYWADTSTLPLDRINFYFGDERCVPSDHAESNYGLVMKTLFAKGVPPGCSVERMEAEIPDQEAAAKVYEKLIPERIDVLLLGVGEDGHIASLFPYSSALFLGGRSVVPIIGPKAPYQRLTITPRVIASARSVFVLATGEKKGKVLAEALKLKSEFMSLPVGLALGGTWLLDAEAGRQLKKHKNP